MGEPSLGPLLLAFHIHSLLPRASPSSDPRDPQICVFNPYLSPVLELCVHLPQSNLASTPSTHVAGEEHECMEKSTL